jgi:hypothetical protein
MPANSVYNGQGASAIEEAYVRQFQEGFEQAYQQDQSILDPLVDRDTQKSEYKSWQRIGEAEEMTEDTTRYGDNPVSEIPHDNRRISLRHYELGKYIDPKDLMKVVSDPSNAYSTALLKSGKRKRDDFLIDKYFGDAYTGKEGSTAVAYARTSDDENDITIRIGELSNGSSNKISATAGRYTLVSGDYEGVSVGANFDGSTGTASGLTIEKLKGLRTAMLRIEAIEQDDVLPMLLTSYQLDDLLKEDEIINADYSVRKNLAEGNVTTYMGYRFILCERLPLSSGSGGDERRCMVFTPKALKLTIGEDLKGDMWKDSSKKNIPYMYFKQSIGASRMWGEVAGEIRCLES